LNHDFFSLPDCRKILTQNGNTLFYKLFLVVDAFQKEALVRYFGGIFWSKNRSRRFGGFGRPSNGALLGRDQITHTIQDGAHKLMTGCTQTIASNRLPRIAVQLL